MAILIYIRTNIYQDERPKGWHEIEWSILDFTDLQIQPTRPMCSANGALSILARDTLQATGDDYWLDAGVAGISVEVRPSVLRSWSDSGSGTFRLSPHCQVVS